MMNLPRQVRRVAGKTGVFAVGAEGQKLAHTTRVSRRPRNAKMVSLAGSPPGPTISRPGSSPERLPFGRLSLRPHGCWHMEPSRSGAVSLKIMSLPLCKRDSQCDLEHQPMNRSNSTGSQSNILNDLVAYRLLMWLAVPLGQRCNAMPTGLRPCRISDRYGIPDS